MIVYIPVDVPEGEVAALLAKLYPKGIVTQVYSQDPTQPPGSTSSGGTSYAPSTGGAGTASPEPADPWVPAGAVGSQQYPTPAPPTPQPSGSGTPGTPPSCKHGQMRYVAAGYSQKTGRPYPAFYGCPADRNAPDKCRSVPA